MAGEQRKLSDLHKINNTTIDSIKSLSAKLGAYGKWTLGLNGGIGEPMNVEQVSILNGESH